MNNCLPEDFSTRVKAYRDELIAFRRDVHRHPELGWQEVRTTRVIQERLEAAGLRPRNLPKGTGLVCDIGEGGSAVALRGDIDALPVQDNKNVPYRSIVPGVCHACGHDVHTTVLLGAGLVLADLAREGRLPWRVRLIFEPAEEVVPCGSLDVITAGALDGVERIFALHCDPRLDVGLVGLRTGALTATYDHLLLRIKGPGGHTSRPHLTVDLVHVLAAMATELPAALSRWVDPRTVMSLVWGRIAAGSAPNAIPSIGELEGAIRCLDVRAWHQAPGLIRELASRVAALYGAEVEIVYQRDVPPVVNDAESVELLRTAVTAALGSDAAVEAEQSLGSEHFAWYLEKLPGALARLGVRTPGDTTVRDLHQGTFNVDERAIEIGVKLLISVALSSSLSERH